MLSDPEKRRKYGAVRPSMSQDGVAVLAAAAPPASMSFRALRGTSTIHSQNLLGRSVGSTAGSWPASQHGAPGGFGFSGGFSRGRDPLLASVGPRGRTSRPTGCEATINLSFARGLQAVLSVALWR